MRRSAPGNFVLSQLPQNDFERLRPHLAPVTLTKGHLLEGQSGESGDLYFLETGLVSLVCAEGPSRVAVAVTGSEGVAGALAALGHSPFAQRLRVEIPGSALRLSSSILLAHRADPPLALKLVDRYVAVIVSQIAQTAVCNRYHTGRQRLARWLLLTADCARRNELPLTHDDLAHMLGGARSLVTTALTDLERRNAVHTSRALIRINRRALAAEACECYRTLARIVERYLAAS